MFLDARLNDMLWAVAGTLGMAADAVPQFRLPALNRHILNICSAYSEI